MMTKGLDTTFLIQAELPEHAGHKSARRLLERLRSDRASLALAPQVLAEFVHIVTDPRRFASPVEMTVALDRAEQWWNGREVQQVYPDEHSTGLFLRWMAEHGLGRKRLLDTQLAATYAAAGITTIVTTNARDYRVFGCFTILTP